MHIHALRAAALAALPAMLLAPDARAQDTAAINAVRNEIHQLRQAYEARIANLEAQLKKVAAGKVTPGKENPTSPNNAAKTRTVHDNSFNPSIGVIFNGKLSAFSENTSEFAGFGVGEEGERGRKGLAIDETELNFSANVDDKFFGSATAAIVREGGEDKIELEEAYIQTLPGAGLPSGLRAKLGRAFWTFGYLNEHHSHADDFADRPLPNRVFLNNSFNDDGAEVAWVLPTNFYSEVGAGLFRGDDFPLGGATEGISAWSAFARVGGDIGRNQSWRIGGYVLSGDTDGRSSNEDEVSFIGSTRLYGADIRYVWAPTGNNQDSEVILQGEFFHRKEKGTYEDSNAGTGAGAFDDSSNGWYLQSIYKFDRNWRTGARYSRLTPADVNGALVGSALDSSGHDPQAFALMTDWSNSEFSRVRLQYNYEELAQGKDDHQLILQYVMSIGAHGAHAY